MDRDARRLTYEANDVFCANPSCVLHVRAGDAGVSGSGQWAVIDGITYDRHPLTPGGPCYCSKCRLEIERDSAESARPLAG